MYVGKVKGKEAKRRNNVWYARDRAASICEYFPTEKEATEFAEDWNSNRRRRSHNLAPTNKAMKKWSVQLLIRSYMHSGGTVQWKMSEAGDDLITATHEAYNDEDELIESCGLQENLSLMLLKFSSDPICQKSLFDFTHQVAEKYAADQLKATYISNGSDAEKKYAPGTVRRNITAIQNVWEWGRKTFPQLANLENPWERIRINGGSGGKRQRGLRKGELEKLLEACKKCRGTNRYYVPLAEFERSLILARTGEGRTRAMARGVKFGRKPKLSLFQIEEAKRRREAGESHTEIARSYNVSHQTIGRLGAVHAVTAADKRARDG